MAMLGRLSDSFSSVLPDYLFSRSVGNLVAHQRDLVWPLCVSPSISFLLSPPPRFRRIGLGIVFSSYNSVQKAMLLFKDDSRPFCLECMSEEGRTRKSVAISNVLLLKLRTAIPLGRHYWNASHNFCELLAQGTIWANFGSLGVGKNGAILSYSIP